MDDNYAPIRTSVDGKGWEGSAQIKPWEYQITAAIPVLDTPDELELVIALLRLQTVKPYIVVIDTGSKEHAARIEGLRSYDIEVHLLRLGGVPHPSDFPAIAMDLAFSACRTKYLFATHADCFLRRPDFLENLLALTNERSPVVGYEITPRQHEDWHGMVSHTATMYYMPIMDKIGFGWSQRRLCNLVGIEDKKPNPLRPNWPDTELLGNYILRSHSITPKIIGQEQNFVPTIDQNIYHARTLTAGKLYSPDYYAQAQRWANAAMMEAGENIKKWSIDITPIGKGK